jgi:hypothetical protein
MELHDYSIRSAKCVMRVYVVYVYRSIPDNGGQQHVGGGGGVCVCGGGGGGGGGRVKNFLFTKHYFWLAYPKVRVFWVAFRKVPRVQKCEYPWGLELNKKINKRARGHIRALDLRLTDYEKQSQNTERTRNFHNSA